MWNAVGSDFCKHRAVNHRLSIKPYSENYMLRKLAAAALLVAPVVGTTFADVVPSFQLIGPVFATDVSADGSVIVGNTQGAYETFRWTQSTGVVPLGRATVPALGVGAGLPKVSADGTRVTGTILDDTLTAATQGLWKLGTGWQQLMPPSLPDGAIVDQSWGSSWGLSGDGKVVSGLYWRNTNVGGLAHASRWVEGVGLTDLGSDGGASRANSNNFDGSVIVGFDENPIAGNRRAAVWTDGVRQFMDSNPDNPGEANAVNSAGNIVVGEKWNDVDFYNNATIWTRNGSSWTTQQLGLLPGTDPIFGSSVATDVNEDGTMVIGLNRFDFFGGTAFVWTPQDGMLDVTQWVTNLGLTLDPDYVITELAAISQDGSTVIGMGYDMNTFEFTSFAITVPEPSSLSLIGLSALGLLRWRRISR